LGRERATIPISARSQIEYEDEDPEVRQWFDEGLAREGVENRMGVGIGKRS